ncbi:GatB/YqeY domain-containing protein [Pleomorphomonas sp. JP5]|uniref:GatB/YqeY domain-containing protein n=1 Tax=Pleomorphomonas sp. JP5 TaxID=2942998 RepID=UPI00204499A0|nr:GatB/YqeY domain-containing protein [Pleomorphomonas sp. JP5]MCM5557402.1 GatB/YqeY domain-containing protein [Pleomorphomonas sp. JP5]
MTDITPTTPADTMKADLRRDLVVAMKRRDKAETSLLRLLIGAIDNAEAVPATGSDATPLPFGAGTAEARRRHLTEDDIRAIFKWEMDDRTAAAAEFARLGVAARSAALTAEVETIRRYVRG